MRFEPSSSGATVQDLEIATGIALKVGAPPDLTGLEYAMIREAVAVLDGISTFVTAQTLKLFWPISEVVFVPTMIAMAGHPNESERAQLETWKQPYTQCLVAKGYKAR